MKADLMFEMAVGTLPMNEDTENDIQSLKDWLNKQPHLPKFPDDRELIYAYEVSKRNVQKTKKLFDEACTVGTYLVQNYKKWDQLDSALNQCFDTVAMTVLDKRTPDDSSVIIGKMLDTRPERMVIDDYLIRLMMMQQLAMSGLLEISTQNIVVVDGSGASLQHILNIGLSKIKVLISLWRVLVRETVKKVHVVNASKEISTIMMFINPIFPEEFRHLLMFHNDLESLYQHVPKEILPSDFGGDAPSMKEINEIHRKNTFVLKNAFLERTKYLVDESKRQKEIPFKSDCRFGVEGSFKKLCID